MVLQQMLRKNKYMPEDRKFLLPQPLQFVISCSFSEPPPVNHNMTKHHSSD